MSSFSRLSSLLATASLLLCAAMMLVASSPVSAAAGSQHEPQTLWRVPTAASPSLLRGGKIRSPHQQPGRVVSRGADPSDRDSLPMHTIAPDSPDLVQQNGAQAAPFVPQPWPYSPSNPPCTSYERQDDCVGNAPLRSDALPSCAGVAGPAPANTSLFAIIGDYGIDGLCLNQVAQLLQKIQKQFGEIKFVMTTGDNAYWVRQNHSTQRQDTIER